MSVAKCAGATCAGRRAALRLLVLGAAIAATPQLWAQGQAPIKLFKVVTSKDQITIGVSTAELAAMGSGEDVSVLAKALVANGQITVWQYAVGRDAAGNLQMNPLRRVAIIRHDTTRIETDSTPYKIAPPRP